MKLIAHRGNTNGIFESWENEPTYIDMAISRGYDVEVDVWYKDDMLWLGHDKPLYVPEHRFFEDRKDKLWIHCKNLEAANYFKNCGYQINYFWHQNDDFTLTSSGYFWTYPGKELTDNSIAVMPETVNYTEEELKKCYGICSDNIKNYKKL